MLFPIFPIVSMRQQSTFECLPLFPSGIDAILKRYAECKIIAKTAKTVPKSCLSAEINATNHGNNTQIILLIEFTCNDQTNQNISAIQSKKKKQRCQKVFWEDTGGTCFKYESAKVMDPTRKIKESHREYVQPRAPALDIIKCTWNQPVNHWFVQFWIQTGNSYYI